MGLALARPQVPRVCPPPVALLRLPAGGVQRRRGMPAIWESTLLPVGNNMCLTVFLSMQMYCIYSISLK